MLAAELQTDLCELLDNENSNISSDSSNGFHVKRQDSSEAERAAMGAVLDPLLRQVSKAAQDQLYSVLLRCEKERTEEIQALEHKQVEFNRKQREVIDGLSHRIRLLEQACLRERERYYVLGDKCGAYIGTKIALAKRTSILGKYMQMWKNSISHEKRLIQLEKLSQMFQNKITKTRYFCSMSKTFIRNRCEQERDEYVSRLDAIARKVRRVTVGVTSVYR